MHAVGDGALRYAEPRGRATASTSSAPALSFPPPATLLALALDGSSKGDRQSSPVRVVPLYMREADAKSNFARAEGPELAAVPLRIEKLRRRDLRHVLRIEATVFPEPWSVEVFNSELALRKGRLYRAAWDGQVMAGYIGFMIVDDEAHMTTIATAPSHQRVRGGHAR